MLVLSKKCHDVRARQFLLLLCMVLFASLSIAQNAILTITNPSSYNRNDELIVITRQDLEQQLGSISSRKYIIIETSRPILVQHDDLNKDGQWDEIAFLHSFQKKETKLFTVRVSVRPSSWQGAKRVEALLSKKQPDGSFKRVSDYDTMPFNHQPHNYSSGATPLYQFEGPVWINDKVAFHAYYDARNLKTVSSQVWDTSMTNSKNGTPVESQIDGSKINANLFKNDLTLGAGTLALLVKEQNKNDTLIGLGGPQVEKSMYRLITDGPVRAIFQLQYENIKMENKEIFVQEEISIWGGQFFFENKIFARGLHNERIVTGLGNIFHSELYQLKSSNQQIIYTHGKENASGDFLAMGIITENNNFAAFNKTPDAGKGIIKSYTAIFNPRANMPVTFRLYAGWQNIEQRFSDRIYFENFLKEEADKWANPLKLKWQHSRTIDREN